MPIPRYYRSSVSTGVNCPQIYVFLGIIDYRSVPVPTVTMTPFFSPFRFRFRRHVGTVFKTLYPKVAENEIEKVRKKDTFPKRIDDGCLL
jgi:hypothetical protein